MAMLALATLCQRVDPARTAVVQGGQRWTYGELDHASARLARMLRQRGVVADGLVAYSLPNGPGFLALTLAIYRCGATPAPLSPRLPEPERAAILAIMQPCCHVTQDDVAAIDLPGDETAATAQVMPVAASWKACTSGGSTGRPKVIVDRRPAAFEAGTGFIDIPPGGTIMVPGPLYHNATFSAAVFALWLGCTVITMPRFDAAEALDLIAREQVEWAMMVPTMMGRIMALPAAQRDPARMPHWHRVVHTASPMAAWLKQDWIDWFGPDHIWEVYGATEGLVRCWIGGAEWMERPGSVGRPIGGARIRILDEAGQDMPPGEQGEVFAMPTGGQGSTYRYIGAQSRATADGWESVGDIGWLDDQGYLYLADRRDDLIISGGINIWPAEVETAILRHPAVASCAVWGMPDADLGARVHALIEADERRLDRAALGRFLDQYLARAKHPRSIAFTSKPVRDDAGKIRKPRQTAQETP
ncbi:AMP-binding protein [Novosphingobium colocasiae]|uniref:AMP-binding protein n=1 Tax=Novosphingobium colocasiae TaxID=1256513 RepID=UPI0035B162B2